MAAPGIRLASLTGSQCQSAFVLKAFSLEGELDPDLVPKEGRGRILASAPHNPHDPPFWELA